MATIPASALVKVLPGVLNAGGNALVMNGLCLSSSRRAPLGQVLSFPSGPAVAAYFGAGSVEDRIANGGAGFGSGYFGGFNGAEQLPAALLFAQYNQGAAPAWLRGASVANLTLAQLQAITGTLNLTVDGYPRTIASLDLSGATSFSSAAALIQTAFNASEPTEFVTTGTGSSIAPATSAFTGGIEGDILTVSAVASGLIVPGTLVAGSGVAGSTIVTSQLTGTPNGIGTYAVTVLQSVPAATSMTGGYGVLTIGTLASGTVSVGQTLSGSGITSGTAIYGLGTGQGAAGTYYVSPSQTAAATTITGAATNLTVAYDSVSGGFLITSGILGPSSIMAASATGGTAAALGLTAAVGAVVSQGAAAAAPAAFMTALAATTQNWGTFFLSFDPDDGVGNTQKLLFAGWVNGQNNRYAFVCWDTDITPTLGASAGSMGAILAASNSSGTILIYCPSDLNYAAFVSGMAASVNFGLPNGRTDFAFRGQTGLVASVTNETIYDNLIANGYNCYAAFATANQSFVEFQPGSVSGPFEWADSFINQIYLNSQLQLAGMELLQNALSVPYNAAGYAQVEAALVGPLDEFVTFGGARVGIPLSASQIQQINNQAGKKVSDTIFQQGYVIVIIAATPQTRQARKSPGVLIWYADGQSIQQIVMSSTLVQ